MSIIRIHFNTIVTVAIFYRLMSSIPLEPGELYSESPLYCTLRTGKLYRNDGIGTALHLEGVHSDLILFYI